MHAVCFRRLLGKSISPQFKWDGNLKVSASLNLASQPFRNRALPWTIAGVITVVSLLVLVILVSKSSETNTRAAAVEREVDGQRQQISALERRIEEIKQALTPEQLQTLQAAQSLVDRKRFSWARLFADLEAALPGSVRVRRISVRDVAVRGDRTVADLELVVVSKNPADVTAMILEMDRTGVFRSELVEQNLQKERNETGTESTLRVIYQPRGSVPATATSDNKVAAANIAQAMNMEVR
jgi:Tfp pilus assembly protein PilN